MIKGSKMTEEQRRRNREIQKNVWANPELRKKHSQIHKGQKAWNKGISPSNETIEKQKATYRRTLLANPEIRKRMSLSHKGKRRSEEAIRKFSLKMKGHKVSEETRRKISEAQKGKIIPEETKRKISEATKKAMTSPEMKERLSKIKKEQFKLGKAKSWSKGRKGVYSKELLERWSKSHKKTMANPETREKVSLSLKKTYDSHPEILKKMAEKQKERMSNPELREIARRNTLKMYESGSFPKQTNTKPERQIKEELIKRGYQENIDFIHQYKFNNKFMCDFCFPKQKVIIEVDGDFWHGNPNKYSDKDKLHPHQIKGINRDKSKDAYIKKFDNGSWTIIRIWESEIKKDVVKCVNKIVETLNSKSRFK